VGNAHNIITNAHYEPKLPVAEGVPLRIWYWCKGVPNASMIDAATR